MSSRVEFTYKNYKGEVAERRVEPLYLWFGKSPFHEGFQHFLRATDCEKGAVRDFAVADMKNVRIWKKDDSDLPLLDELFLCIERIGKQ